MQNVGPKDPAATVEPPAGPTPNQTPRYDPGFEKSWGEAGGYGGEALARGAASLLPPAINPGEGSGVDWAAGTIGKALGEGIGGTLGSAADWVAGEMVTVEPPPDLDGGMSMPEVGAGMSLPQGASADADAQPPMSSSDMSTDLTGGMSAQPPPASVDPGMSVEPPFVSSMDMAQGG